jgi:hypothetical protein
MEKALYVQLESETNKVSGSVLGTKVMRLHNYHAVSWSKKSSLLDSKAWFDKFKADEAAQHVTQHAPIMQLETYTTRPWTLVTWKFIPSY